ncbi:MAG TPA: cache domain-containing protein [Nitrosopumilaceae archaeon]|nr:cache domain-containing protein [Nitrosopumilaceae archaeon]
MQIQFFSLDKKLIFLVMIVSIIALSTTAVLSFNFSQDVLKDRINDQLISESDLRGNAIRNVFDTRIKETQILSTDPMIQNLVEELNQNQHDSDLKSLVKEKRGAFLTEIKTFRELVGYSIGFFDVKIIGNQGVVYFSLGKLSDSDFSQDPRYVLGLTGPFVDIEPTSNEGRKIVVSTPIFSRENGSNSEPIGVIIADMSTTAIDDILLNRGGLGNTGEVYLVNDDFFMVSESRFIENAAFNQKVNTLPVQDCFERNVETGGLYADYRNVMIYGYSYCAKDLGLVLLAEVDESETFRPVLILQDKIFQAGILITIGMGAGTYFLSKLISRPIIKLKNAANEIANGNFDVRTNIKSGDEIGALSTSFDSMAKKIQESLIAIKQREDVIKHQQDILLHFSDYSANYFVCIIDIISSTKITARLTDLESSKLYTTFLNSMATIVDQFEGVVVKNIGDALLFYFPKTNAEEKEHLKNALECCFKMSESHKEINTKLENQSLPSINYRISATYGSVRIAKVATSSIEDIFGSTVNRCSKINPLAPPNGIAIGDDLYQLVKNFDEYVFRKIDDYELTYEQDYSVYSVSRK